MITILILKSPSYLWTFEAHMKAMLGSVLSLHIYVFLSKGSGKEIYGNVFSDQVIIIQRELNQR